MMTVALALFPSVAIKYPISAQAAVPVAAEPGLRDNWLQRPVIHLLLANKLLMQLPPEMMGITLSIKNSLS